MLEAEEAEAVDLKPLDLEILVVEELDVEVVDSVSGCAGGGTDLSVKNREILP